MKSATGTQEKKYEIPTKNKNQQNEKGGRTSKSCHKRVIMTAEAVVDVFVVIFSPLKRKNMRANTNER